jgi:UDP-N-acetylglucosamine acyltransferase
MAQDDAGCIHPTAVIDPQVELAPDVTVGPYAILEGPVKVGPGCRIHARAHLIGPLTLGAYNQIHPNVLIGAAPQHLGYKGEPTRVEIGDYNVIRENCTIHRAMTPAAPTRLGHHNFLMAGAHVAHDCVIGDHCILANNALVAGHCVIENNVFLSGNCAVHQFCRVGRLAFLGGVSGASKDVPPFMIVQHINLVMGVNFIGMRRAGVPSRSISAVRQLYRLVYLQGRSLPNALAEAEATLGDVPEVREFIQFARASKRGICGEASILRLGSGELEAAA